MSKNPDHEFDGDLHTQEGQNLLCDIQVWLPRSPITQEAARGPLIDEEELECYFEHATRWWSGLTEIRKDSVRLAVFAINPITDWAMESRFLSMFTALDGLTKRRAKRRTLLFKFQRHGADLSNTDCWLVACMQR